MPKTYGFISKHRKLPADQRSREAKQQLSRTDREVYPIIMDIYGERDGALGMHRHKFSVSGDATVANILATARRHANPPIRESEALTGFALTFGGEDSEPAQTLLCMSNSVAQIYDGHKSNDDLLYLLFCVENVFG